MKKINFSNLPSTTTPINATNLNLMQDNIEAEIDTDKARISTLESNKVIKNFGTVIFQSVANQKVKIQIPITGTTNINKLIVRVFSNYNTSNYAGILEKTISFVAGTGILHSKTEEYTCIGNNAALGFAIGNMSLVDNNIEIPIALRSSNLTHAKIMIEGYYFNQVAKTALENTTLSGIYTNDSTVYARPTVLEQYNQIYRTTMETNNTPEWYITNHKFKRIVELKQTSVIGLSTLDNATYAIVETYCPWGDVSIPLVQIAQSTKSGRVYKRVATSETAWGNWEATVITEPIEYGNGKLSDTVYATQLRGLEVGGIYEVSIVRNFNTNGDANYRGVLYGILSLPCGYGYNADGTGQVVVRPKFNIISNYNGTPSEEDTSAKVVCEGNKSEINVSTFKTSPQVYICYSNATYLKVEKVNIRKISV